MGITARIIKIHGECVFQITDAGHISRFVHNIMYDIVHVERERARTTGVYDYQSVCVSVCVCVGNE